MKTKRTKAIWLLAGIAFVLALLEGLFYYADVTPLFLRLMLILYNAIKAFLMNPSITLNHIWGQLKLGMGPVETAVAYAYSLALFLAFLCTATALFTSLRHLLQKTTLLTLTKKAEHIFVFGYNKNVQTLLENSAARTEKNKGLGPTGYSRVLHVVTASDIPAERKAAFLKMGIFFHHGDILTMPDRKRQRFLQSVGFPQDGKAILMEDSVTQNISLCLAIQNCQFPKAQLYLSEKTEGFQWLMEEMGNYTREAGLDRKSVRLFSIPELRARSMFRAMPLHSYNIRQLSSPGAAPNWDVHMLIVGLGQTGREILQQTIELGVITGDNRILIDVIDQAAMEQMSMFQSVFHPSYLRPGTPEGELEIGVPQADGQLRIRFHQMDIRANGFRKILETIDKDGPLTYGALCTRDPDLTVYCMTQIQHFLLGKCSSLPPLALRLEQQGPLTSFLARELCSFPNICLMEGSSSVLTVEHILDPTVEEQSIAFHSLYTQISELVGETKSVPSPEQLHELRPKSPDDALADWLKLSYRKQESSRHLCYHDQIKALFLSWWAWNANGNGPFSDYWEQRRDLTSALHDLSAENRSSADRAAFLSASAQAEHRRWCYFMALRGWGASPDGESKNEHRRLSPYMTCWERLSQQYPEMCIYDLIPILTLLV